MNITLKIKDKLPSWWTNYMQIMFCVASMIMSLFSNVEHLVGYLIIYYLAVCSTFIFIMIQHL